MIIFTFGGCHEAVFAWYVLQVLLLLSLCVNFRLLPSCFSLSHCPPAAMYAQVLSQNPATGQLESTSEATYVNWSAWGGLLTPCAGGYLFGCESRDSTTGKVSTKPKDEAPGRCVENTRLVGVKCRNRSGAQGQVPLGGTRRVLGQSTECAPGPLTAVGMAGGRGRTGDLGLIHIEHA